MNETPLEDRLAMLLAGARERLAEAHLTYALDFIQRTADDIEAPRALDIFCRLHRLDEQDSRVLKNRVLVAFGRATGPEEVGATFEAVGGDVEWDVTASLVYRLRRRLGGRRNHTLRRWVELHTGYVEGRLVRVHADNVERMIDAEGPSAGAIADTVSRYARALRLRDSLLESIQIAACERLYPDYSTDQHPSLQLHAGGL